VTFAVRGEASSAASVATSSGVLKRRRGMLDRLLAHRRRVDTGGTAKRRGDALLSEPDVGFDLTGRDAFEADALRAELLRERFRDVQKRRLRHPVVDHHPVGLEEGIDGDDVDHRSLTTEKHRRNRHARCAHVSKRS
jgi:hypothetical protein